MPFRTLGFELKQALRTLGRSPWFTLTSVAMLGAGLGLVLYMFGAIQAFVLRPLPFAESERLMYLHFSHSKSHDDHIEIPPHDFADIGAAQTSFGNLAAYYQGTINVSGDHRPERFDGAFVSANLFETLQVKPHIGAGFRPGDDRAGAAAVAVLSYNLWINRFAGDPEVVGRTIRANGRDTTVVGVMPPHFAFPNREVIWLPFNQDLAKIKRGEGTPLEVFGRLKPEVDIEQAQGQISALVERLAQQYPDATRGDRIVVKPYAERAVSDETRSILFTMQAAVFLVLLIACANVANLLMARGAARARELAIRNALGASRWRLIMNIMAEALLISLAGAAIGLLLAQWGGDLTMQALRSSEDPPPYWTTDMHLDAQSILVALAAAFVTAFVAGLLPAWRSSQAAPAQTMREGGHGSVGGGRAGKILVTAEIALCVVLLICSGLTVRSVIALEQLDLGADISNTLTGRLALFESAYATEAETVQFAERLEERLRALPGVEDAAISTSPPATFAGENFLQPEGVVVQRSEELPYAYQVSVSSAFFPTHRVPLLRGRGFTSQDRDGSTPVAIVSQSLADQVWPGQDPVGRRMKMGRLEEGEPWLTIVGVSANVLHDAGDAKDGTRTVYVPLAQNPSRFFSFAVRTEGQPMLHAAAVREAVLALDADLPVYWLRTLEDWVDIAAFDHRLLATLFGIFGLFAVLLAAAGLYAVLAFAVSQRTREIGVRRALGARDRGIVRMVLRQGMLQIALGLGIGLLISIGFAQLLSNVLFGVGTFDPVTFFGVGILLLCVAILAALAPTRRALAVQPIVALRYE